MSADLLWPGLHRAGGLFDDAAMVAAMVDVEAAWLRALAGAGLAPPGAAEAVESLDLAALDLAALAVEAEAGGNPVIPLLAALRASLPPSSQISAGLDIAMTTSSPPDNGGAGEAAGRLLHLGLTSQDVLDTALVLCARTCLTAVAADLDALVEASAALADRHRGTVMAARTLGQHAVPTTFGARAAGWCRGLVAAREAVARCLETLPVQVGGAAGTMARAVEVCRAAGSADPVAATERLVRDLAQALGLQVVAPWHTTRHPVTGIADTLVTVSDALGHVANDVALQSRPEVAELAEPAGAGRGASSAMPQKRNPVLSVLLRRHAQSAPLLAAQLHLAAAGALEERPDGAWHIEWAGLRDLCRRTVAATRQARELLEGLHVDAPAMRAHVDAALPGLLAERLVPALASLLDGGRGAASSLVSSAASPAELVDAAVSASAGRLTEADVRALLDPTAYLGWAGELVDGAVEAARSSTATAAPVPTSVPPSTDPTRE
ncbi:MAG TPA: lyase family protein [Intrasporangium sp.]|uniref:lyase family protein n=1 Tax=Intrasporangium sp. TaxID=1925024 RepID=UPI002D76839A|nr:lyase family protein [Intrasporangium sp.]HET7398648.1 lyase family protein [Intrasporangium sp.]